MNTIIAYSIQILVTFLIALGAVLYLSHSLRRVLVDLCGTEDRAQFWIHFSSVVLIGMPLVFGLGFTPKEIVIDQVFFEAARQVRDNLSSFLFAFFGLGLVIVFFSAIAPRPVPNKKEGA